MNTALATNASAHQAILTASPLPKRKSSVNQGALKDSATSQDLTSDALAKPLKLNLKKLETPPRQLYLRKSQSVKEKLELGTARSPAQMRNVSALKTC